MILFIDLFSHGSVFHPSSMLFCPLFFLFSFFKVWLPKFDNSQTVLAWGKKRQRAQHMEESHVWLYCTEGFSITVRSRSVAILSDFPWDNHLYQWFPRQIGDLYLREHWKILCFHFVKPKWKDFFGKSGAVEFFPISFDLAFTLFLRIASL